MMCAGPLSRHMAFDHCFEAARSHPQPHINVNDDRANGDQRSRRMDDSCKAEYPTNAKWHAFREPHDNPSQQQNNRAPEEDPIELLLSGIEAALRRHHLITIPDIVLDVLGPFAIAFGV